MPNYLIGNGELLVEPIGPPPRNPSKEHPYTVDEARARLAPMLRSTIVQFEESPALAPNDVHVVKFVLHPAYVAKSYHPGGMLRAAGLEVVGSRELSTRVVKHTGTNDTEREYTTSALYVAGTRGMFLRLAQSLESTEPLMRELGDIREFEAITSFTTDEKMKSGGSGARDNVYELVVHKPSAGMAPDNKTALLAAATSLSVEIDPDRGFETESLWFLPAQGSVEAVQRLASFSTLRVARPMPRLNLEPIRSSATVPSLQLPDPPARREGVRVAILDGGLPTEHPLGPWIELYREANPTAGTVDAYASHGLAVASAYLFGPLNNGQAAGPPPSRVSVIRVLDDSVGAEDPWELYGVLGHVEAVLLSRAFDFVNLSLGPDLPIEDDDVHAWTSVIDDLLADGETLLTVAAGNNGHLDVASGNARVQVPGDAVNALTIGAVGNRWGDWARAPYSALGPGRTPGRIKPDLVVFGGSDDELFHTVGVDGASSVGIMGTSFAAPLAMRQGASIRALLGSDLSPLAVRALMIHAADQGTHDSEQVGWGKLPDDFGEIVVSGDGVARIIYQGVLKPGKYIRAAVPLPKDGLTGMVTMTATFCFATAVDAASPDTYTRAGLEPVFRPDLSKFGKDKFGNDAKTPMSRSFFGRPAYQSETKRRSDFGAWEPVLHNAERMRGSTLVSPVFDVHYNARDGGGISSSKEEMPYALVITLEAPKHINLHQDILEAYTGVLVPIEPTIEVDVDIALES
jgi:hypothetical protein